MSQYKHIEKFLEKVARRVVGDSKDLLKDAKGSTDLAKSIRWTVTEDANGFTTSFWMSEYGAYLDEGVSGKENEITYTTYLGQSKKSRFSYSDKQPPSDIISKWIKKKGITPKGKDKNKERAIKNMAFAVSKSIKIKGIKSLSWFQEPLGLGFRKINEDLLKAVVEDVRSYITLYTIGKGQK